jgi:pyrroloquinoline quinone (PQQ) biosynthesis protein C
MTDRAAAFFSQLDDEVQKHPLMRHPFLERISQDCLTLRQLHAFASQHYLYSQRFARNLAAVLSNTPDENARTLLVMNLHEEIGEPARIRDRVHLLLLEAGVVTGAQLAKAFEQLVAVDPHGDVVALLIDQGFISRKHVASIVEHNTLKSKDLTHPALFRRFLLALGLDAQALAGVIPLEATERFNAVYDRLCRHAHWLTGLGAMGPGTEGIVPLLYTRVLQCIVNTGALTPHDYVFWTVHVHCDEGHSRNIVECMSPYATDQEQQQLIRVGAMEVLQARYDWLDALYDHVFDEVGPSHNEHASATRSDHGSTHCAHTRTS